MIAISSYKKQFDKANKQLSDHQKQLLDIEEEMTTLQKRKKETEQLIALDQKNKITKGMLYYSEQRRTTLLDKAAGLQYSNQAIVRLRSFDKDHWNMDFVDCDTIADFEAIEKYVNDNEPDWERSALAKIGYFFSQDR